MYNEQNNIDKCVSCLQGQTLKDIEIILINDGSTDETERIVRGYEKADNRITVISSKRNGPGAARNLGLDKARGEYIAFVDADDWIEEDAFEKMYKCAKKSEADITVSGFIREVTDRYGNSSSIKIYPFDDSDGTVLSVQDLANRFIERFNFFGFHTLWAKLYKREFLKSTGIRMNEEITLGEDLLFNLAVYKKVNKVCWLKEYLYHYSWKENVNSLSRKYRKDLFEINKLLHVAVLEHMNVWGIVTDSNKISVYREFFAKIYACVIQELRTKKSIFPKLCKLHKISRDKEVRQSVKVVPIKCLNKRELVLYFLFKYRLI
jgi:glycosyltransferase EpsH